MTRLERLAKLIDWYGQTVEDYDMNVEEDLRPYFAEGGEPPAQFVCVTQHGEKTFFLPKYAWAEDAQARAVEYVTDDIFAETPVEVYDLDTGESWRPEWSTVDWTLHKRSRAE